MTYETTPKQDQAIREWLQEAIMPLIEQVLVKKLGQAMSFAASEVVQPKKDFVGLTDEEIQEIAFNANDEESAIYQAQDKLREKNT